MNAQKKIKYVVYMNTTKLYLLFSVRLEVQGDYELRDGGLDGLYKIVFVDFHWGSDDEIGSEHQFNGNSFPMEVIKHPPLSPFTVNAAVFVIHYICLS